MKNSLKKFSVKKKKNLYNYYQIMYFFLGISKKMII